MANLSGTRTSGENNWDFYVVKSKNYNLRIEDKQTAILYEKPNLKSKGISLKEKTPVTIINPKLHSTKGYPKLQFALCKVGKKRGYILISKLRKPSKAGILGTLQDEDVAITSLNELISKSDKPITIDILDATGRVFVSIKQCLGARKIEGTPKADFALYNKEGNQIFISHKAAGGAKAFQQYSGTSDSSGTVISEHPEVKAFLKKLTKYVGKDGLTNPCMTVIKDKKLVSYSIFGPDYGKAYGINNVHIVAQGKPILKKTGKYRYSLLWSDNYAINGDVKKFKDDYLPVLGATFRSGRNFVSGGKVYRGARVACYPKSFLTGRNKVVTFK